MKRITIIAFVMLIASAVAVVSFAESSFRNKKTINSLSFYAIQAALPEFTAQGLGAKNFNVTAYELIDMPSLLFVVFYDGEIEFDDIPNKKGKFPEFTVEVSKDSLKVIRSHFSR